MSSAPLVLTASLDDTALLSWVSVQFEFGMMQLQDDGVMSKPPVTQTGRTALLETSLKDCHKKAPLK